jgi:hypothetical protein
MNTMHIVDNAIIILGVVVFLHLCFIERTRFEASKNQHKKQAKRKASLEHPIMLQLCFHKLHAKSPPRGAS